MNRCYTCKEWTMQGGYRCKRCGDIMIDCDCPKLYSKNYWLWIKENFYAENI